MITPGELQIGQRVTVLRHLATENDGFGGNVLVTRQDRSWCGKPLEIVGIQLPYVAVRDLLCDYGTPISLDMRETELMELRPDYVATLLKETK